MNEAQILEELAATDAYAPQAPLPPGAWTRDAALAEIERRIEMRTQQRISPPTPPRWRSQGWLVAAAAFVVVLIVGGVMLARSSNGGDPAIEPTTVATTMPTTETTIPAPDTTVLPLAVEPWQRVGAEVMGAAVGLSDIARTGSGLIAVGFDPGEDSRQDGVIFASDDGVAWTRLAEDDPALVTGTVLIYGIAEVGPGVVAVGMSCDDDAFPCGAGPYPTVWTLADEADGTSWSRSAITTDLFGAMEDVVATDYGIIAAGWFSSPIDGADDGTAVWTRPAVWLSPEGADWARVWEGDPVATEEFPPGVNRILSLAVAPDGLIVGVGSAQNALGEEIAAVWISEDGRNWERIDPDSPALSSDTGLDVTMIDVASGPAGFIAVGNEGGTEVAIWRSPDGQTWTRVDNADQGYDSTGVLSAVAAHDTGWVAAGFGPSFGEHPVTVWTSADGSTWDRAHALDTGYAQAIAVTDTGTVMAGGIFEAEDFHAAVWMGTINE